MDKMPRSKDRSRGELEKLREMNSREKLEYVWNYYSYYIIGTAIAVAFTVSLLTTCFGRPDIGLSIEWSVPYIEQESFDAITAALDERLFGGETEPIVRGTLGLFVSDDPVLEMSQRERLLAVITAGDVDLFITDESTLKEYSMMEYILPLDILLPEIEAQNNDVYQSITSELVDTQYGFEDLPDAGRTTGIRITESPLLDGLSVSLYEDAYLCVSITVKNYDNAIRAIIEFFR